MRPAHDTSDSNAQALALKSLRLAQVWPKIAAWFGLPDGSHTILRQPLSFLMPSKVSPVMAVITLQPCMAPCAPCSSRAASLLDPIMREALRLAQVDDWSAIAKKYSLHDRFPPARPCRA